MSDDDFKPRDASGWIDRLFRFVEMVGITALLLVVLEPVLDRGGHFFLLGLGSMLSAAYLTEPLLNRLMDFLGMHTADKTPMQRLTAWAIVTAAVAVPLANAVATLAQLMMKVVAK